MGSRRADSLAVVKRAAKAGWKTERTNDGRYYIWDAQNRKHVVHLTLSDSRYGLVNLTQDLIRGGLLEAEKTMAERTITERRSRTQIAKEQAEEKIKEANNRSRVAKAANGGPYLTEPEQCDEAWLTTPHPLPWMRWMYITPDVAQTLLDEHNDDNRPLNAKQVDHYTRVILSGQWKLTHQGIAIDSRGKVQDAQHRLGAIVAAGEEVDDLKVPFQVTVGMPVENFKAIDEGLLRSASHLLGKSGEKNASTLSNMIRLVSAYKDGNPRRMMRIKATNQQVIDAFEENPDEFRLCATRGQASYRKVNAQAGAIAAALYVIRKANGVDNVFVEAFFEGLVTGRKAGTRVALDDDDPRAVFREFMTNNKMKSGANKRRIVGLDSMAMIILSWNNCVTNNRPRLMKFAEEAPVPRVVVCKDTGPNASTVPAVFAGEIEFDEDADQ